MVAVPAQSGRAQAVALLLGEPLRQEVRERLALVVCQRALADRIDQLGQRVLGLGLRREAFEGPSQYLGGQFRAHLRHHVIVSVISEPDDQKATALSALGRRPAPPAASGPPTGPQRRRVS